jgi:hypothetical protein
MLGVNHPGGDYGDDNPEMLALNPGAIGPAGSRGACDETVQARAPVVTVTAQPRPINGREQKR